MGHTRLFGQSAHFSLSCSKLLPSTGTIWNITTKLPKIRPLGRGGRGEEREGNGVTRHGSAEFLSRGGGEWRYCRSFRIREVAIFWRKWSSNFVLRRNFLNFYPNIQNEIKLFGFGGFRFRSNRRFFLSFPPLEWSAGVSALSSRRQDLLPYSASRRNRSEVGRERGTESGTLSDLRDDPMWFWTIMKNKPIIFCKINLTMDVINLKIEEKHQ